MNEITDKDLQRCILEEIEELLKKERRAIIEGAKKRLMKRRESGAKLPLIP